MENGFFGRQKNQIFLLPSPLEGKGLLIYIYTKPTTGIYTLNYSSYTKIEKNRYYDWALDERFLLFLEYLNLLAK